MHTTLHPVHSSLGASFTEFAGWQMPVRYTSELAEHRAVRQRAGLFDLSHMGEIAVEGPQAAVALDYALVGALSSVEVGRARYTMICHADGGVLDDLVVYRLGEQRFLVVANAGNTDLVAAELTARAGGFDAAVTDRSAETALIAVQGPRAAQIVSGAVQADLSALKYYGCVPAAVSRHRVLLARTGYTGEDGFEVYCPASEAVAVWSILWQTGLPHGLLAAGLACRDTLRLEAGMPLYGHELTAAMSPFDAGLGRVVGFAKPGDFVGRAALEGGGSPERVLVGLRGVGRRAPRQGNPLSDGDREVGVVTSGALSPTLGHPIAMGYVPPELGVPGTALTADVRGRVEPLVVTPMPFYRRG